MTAEQRLEDARAPGGEAPSVGQAAIVEMAFGAVGIVLIVVLGRSIADSFGAPVHRWIAAPIGLGLGVLLGGAFGLGVTRPVLAERIRPFLARFTSSKPTALNFAVIGLAAAIGEETLFRAAIQPSAGILIAATLFTVAHAAIADFRHPTPGKLAYALLAFAMGIVLGLEYEHLGIAASMATHFGFDTTALLAVRPLLSVRATP
jgi:membrane protease YdiL (CAAX protease family)